MIRFGLRVGKVYLKKNKVTLKLNPSNLEGVTLFNTEKEALNVAKYNHRYYSDIEVVEFEVKELKR